MRIQVEDSVIADGRQEMTCLGRLNPWREMAVVELVVRSEAPAPYVISCMMQGAGIVAVPSPLSR